MTLCFIALLPVRRQGIWTVFFMPPEFLQSRLAEQEEYYDLCVLEGAMGFAMALAAVRKPAPGTLLASRQRQLF